MLRMVRQTGRERWAALLWGALLGCWACLGGCGSGEKAPVVAAKRELLASGSAPLLSRALPGVSLEMDLTELLRKRPHLKRVPAADREQLKVYEEQLAGQQGRALYFFGGPAQRLQRIQIASQLDRVDAIVERVLALQQQLGAPSGIWDCPASGGQLPTRRYSYQRGPAAAMDVFAIIGEHALATYYVASGAQLRGSLQLADCQPVSPERAARFPVVPAPQ